jgi:chemotaxis protein MotB
MFSFASFSDGGMDKVNQALSKSFGKVAEESRNRADKIKKAIASKAASKDIVVTEVNGELQVAFASSFLFESGSASLVPAAEAPLKAFIQSIKPEMKNLRIVVEGHTDDRPIATAEFKSNWELSSARAATVVHFLEAAEFPSDHLEAVGFGSTRPIAPNREIASQIEIPENQAKNRRVLIRVISVDKKSQQ